MPKMDQLETSVLLLGGHNGTAVALPSHRSSVHDSISSSGYALYGHLHVLSMFTFFPVLLIPPTSQKHAGIGVDESLASLVSSAIRFFSGCFLIHSCLAKKNIQQAVHVEGTKVFFPSSCPTTRERGEKNPYSVLTIAQQTFSFGLLCFTMVRWTYML